MTARFSAAERSQSPTVLIGAFAAITIALFIQSAGSGEPDDADFHDGPFAGSLKSDDPLPIYGPDPQHLWNRLFAAFYIRPSRIPDVAGGEPVARIEGGDTIDFLAWDGTTYWDEPAVATRLQALLDEFLAGNNAELFDDPLRRAILLRDLWAAFDYLVGQNIRRRGTVETRRQRDELCSRLARAIEALALSPDEIARLPDNYAAAIASGGFQTNGLLDPHADYLPAGLLSQPDEWVEMDFFKPNVHEDMSARRITLHTRSYRGRSCFRVFYRFPGGRSALVDYLAKLEATGIDWKQAAQDGFILLTPEAPQLPVGTEFALVQQMLTLDDQLRPTPTPIVESVRLRSYPSVDGTDAAGTNTGLGMNVLEYTLKRRLLFDNLRNGGLAREDERAPIYRVIFQGDGEPDWGHDRRKVLFQQCVDCHMSPNADRVGVHSVASIVHSGGFDAGAQAGLAFPAPPDAGNFRGERDATWKSTHETYRRLLEYVDR